MIFQEPVASLNPCFTIGFQLEETLRFHLGMDRRTRRARAIELLEQVGISDGAQRLGCLPAPDVGRPVPARDDRHGHRLQSQASDCRRAHHSTRCDHSEADPRFAHAPPGRARHGAHHDHPQYRRRRRDRRSRGRAVPGPQDGRVGRADPLHRAQIRIHARAARLPCPRMRLATACRRWATSRRRAAL